MRLDFINVRKGKKLGRGGGGREREKKAIRSTTLIT